MRVNFSPRKTTVILAIPGAAASGDFTPDRSNNAMNRPVTPKFP
jgi:hypothetical protein